MDKATNETIKTPLELLLLNDLLLAEAIDKDIYDKATQIITSSRKKG